MGVLTLYFFYILFIFKIIFLKQTYDGVFRSEKLRCFFNFIFCIALISMLKILRVHLLVYLIFLLVV